jgi:hypothetical protein
MVDGDVMIPVHFWNAHPDTVDATGMWDLAVLHALFDHSLWRPVRAVPFQYIDQLGDADGGAVVVVSGRYHNRPGDVIRLQTAINRLPWCLLIVTSDEAHEFPVEKISHPNLRLWVQTPDPARPAHQEAFGFGVGWPPQARGCLEPNEHLAMSRPLDAFFAGQVTHPRRQDCVNALHGAWEHEVQVIETEGFTQGVDHETYFRLLASAKAAPCPSGPQTVDSFRVWEALEAGCVPLVDVCTPQRIEKGYWTLVCGEPPPFPHVFRWDEAPEIIRQVRDDWPSYGNRVSAWWQRQKRRLAYRLRDDTRALMHGSTGPVSAQASPLHLLDNYADLVTVIVPTSPIPSHPSTDVIDETLDSIRDQLGNDVEVIVMIDGVREEQQERRADFEAYTQALLWNLNRASNVLPVLHESHQHQAAMTRHALSLIETPLVLFVEHDTPLTGEIPWPACAYAILAGHADVVRFHHEASVLKPHRHLMLDGAPNWECGFPAMRTVQWSQRPHLASAAYYAHILEAHFAPEDRTMIEDVMYGVVTEAFNIYGEAGWHRHRLWLYAPEGSMVRSRHLDGRGDDPKFENHLAREQS